MRIEVEDFKRQKLFEQYDNKTNPFLFVTTKVDITNIYNYCKLNRNFFATMGYFISLVVNEMDCFKYRKENGKIYKYDTLKTNFTEMIDEDNIGFFICDYVTSYKDFIENFKTKKENLLNSRVSTKNNDQGEVWLSCAPWYEFTSVISPFNKDTAIPQFIWSKYYEENEKMYINLTIMVHHGFADGNHIGLFLKKFNEKINEINEYIK